MVKVSNNVAIDADIAWRLLIIFCAYRLLMVSAFWCAIVIEVAPPLLGQLYPSLFFVTSLIYGAVAIVFMLLAATRVSGFYFQVLLQLGIDIGVITLLMHASDGVSSGLGMLLIMVIAAGGILISGYIATALAAIAALAVLFEHSYLVFFQGIDTDSHYTQAGLLGMAFFATALLSQVLMARARKSEKLVVQRERDLANLDQLNEYIVQQLKVGVLVVAHNGAIRLINQMGRELLALPAKESLKHLSIKLIPSLADRFTEWQQNPTWYQPKTIYVDLNQPEIQVKFISLGASYGTLIFLEDTSVIARQAQQLKLASLGRLTASIAHEIRNPLGAISHAAQLLDESAALHHTDERQLLKIILSHCDRVNSIIKNVLQLGYQGPSLLDSIALKPWLTSFLEEFCATKEIHLEQVALQVDPEHAQAYANPSQLYQIVWNLCDNAWRHAQGSGYPPYFQIIAGIEEHSRQVFLEVIDTGSGVPNEIAEKIFEPFSPLKVPD